MIPELDALHRSREEGAEIAGFAVVVEGAGGDPERLRDRPAARILDAFVGPWGRRRVQGALGAMCWAGALPGARETLSTWSAWSDEAHVCVVEGDLYANAFGRRAAAGNDDALAKSLLDEFLRRGPDAVNELSGLFSGFVYSKESGRLAFFLDPTGSRMLYYRLVDGRCEVASSVYGLAAGRRPLRIDPVALNEDLVFGAPLAHRMVFEGVKVVAPGKVIEFDGRRFIEHRYFRFPSRRPRMSRGEIGEMICGAIERSARHLDLAATPTSLGMSGGKDSRVVCGAIVHAGLRPLAFTFRLHAGDVDADMGLRVSEAVGLETSKIHIDHLPDSDEMVGLSVDSAVLSDGFTAGPGFLALAASAARHSRILFTGFAGDCLSGSWSGVEPWRARTIDELSRINQEHLGYVVPPVVAAELLLPEFRVPLPQLLENWVESYRRENEDFGDLVSTHIAMRIGQRNRRWGATFYQSMRAACTPAQLFGAREVMEAYLTVPVSALKGQRAHAIAAAHRFPALGAIPTSKSLGRIPLRWEPLARLPLRWRYGSRIRRQRRDGGAPSPPSATPRKLTFRTRRFAEAMQQASMIDQTYLRDRFLPRLGDEYRAALHKITATVLHADFGARRQYLLPPFFLSPGDGRS